MLISFPWAVNQSVKTQMLTIYKEAVKAVDASMILFSSLT